MRVRPRASCKSPSSAARLSSPLPLRNLLGPRTAVPAGAQGSPRGLRVASSRPFMPSSSEPGGQRAAPLGRSGPGSFPGRRSPLSGGLLSGMPGSPRGLGTLTATEAATGLSDFHVRSWRDPMPPRGRLLRARCCPGPGPVRVCRASGDGTLVWVRLRPAAPASGGPGPFLPCGQQRSPRAGHRRSDRLASRASFQANPDLTMRVQGGPEVWADAPVHRCPSGTSGRRSRRAPRPRLR